MSDLMQRLQEPFAPAEIRWRVGRVSRDGKWAFLLAYIDARAVMDRLDEVVGPERWEDSYRDGPGGVQICTLRILMAQEPELNPDGVTAPRVVVGAWVAKEGGSDPTQIEAVKGALSGALKRAAVKWGIGRYLYRLPEARIRLVLGAKEYANGRGVDVSDKGKHIGWVPYPDLPSWALPTDGRRETRTEAQVRRAQHDPEWERTGRARFCAQLTEMGWTYDDVRELCAELGRPKPSEMEAGRRDALLQWLGTEGARERWTQILAAREES